MVLRDKMFSIGQTSCLSNFGHSFIVFWRGYFSIIWPCLCLLIFLHRADTVYRCIYLTIVMAGYWVTECLPLPVTSMIPIVFFPLMGILDTESTCMTYFKETNVMFLGGIMIAIAVEHSKLHIRIAMTTILLIGCSPRRLHFGLMFMTTFISMWISNTAACAMMCPIIIAVLEELEQQGLGQMYIKTKAPEKITDMAMLEEVKADDVKEDDTKSPTSSLEEKPKLRLKENVSATKPSQLTEEEESDKRPSDVTICYFLSAAYGASIGGVGTLVGTGTNLTFRGIYETRFPKSDGISFTSWMLYCMPISIIMSFFTWLWLEVLYLGLFRPNSSIGRQVQKGKENESIAREIIRKKNAELGRLTWHEFWVGLLFLTVVFLWFFRNPGFVKGWPTYFTTLKTKDATPALLIVILMFLIPAEPKFCRFFHRSAENRPTTNSPGLLTWKVLHSKMPWGLMFLLGGGFALAEGAKESGMSTYLGNSLTSLNMFHPLVILIIVCTFASCATEFSSNVAIANIILPVLMEMSVAIEIHPLYLTMPAAICCSFAFMLPVGTPPNAIVAGVANIRTADMAVAGLGVSLITGIILVLTWPTYGHLIYPLDEFPDWANHTV